MPVARQPISARLRSPGSVEGSRAYLSASDEVLAKDRLHDQLPVVLFLDDPVVPRGKLEIQQADPLQHVRGLNATVTRTRTRALS
jgi:hypothetical protein